MTPASKSAAFAQDLEQTRRYLHNARTERSHRAPELQRPEYRVAEAEGIPRASGQTGAATSIDTWVADLEDNVRYRHRRRYRRRGTHPDPSFRRWRQGWWNGWWNGWWLSRPRTLGRRLRRHRGDWTELLAVGARPRQGLCLLLIDLDYFRDTQGPGLVTRDRGLSR